MDKITNDSRIYTDMQGMEKLRGELKTNPNAVKKEMAHQFESLLIQMVLRSMRDANKPLSSDLLSSNDMDIYQDIFDKQLSLVLSNRGVGLAASIEKNIDDQQHDISKDPLKATLPMELKNPINGHVPMNLSSKDHIKGLMEVTQSKLLDQPAHIKPLPDTVHIINRDHQSPTQQAVPEEKTTTFNSQHEFIKSLWDSAKQAAQALGVHPGLLLAQAALETNWGKKILAHADGKSSHNLFNIKADNSWKKDTMSVSSIEQKDGVLIKEKSHYRSYQSFADSFKDYVQFIKHNFRYNKALEHVSQPHAYAQALQEAGYATDNKYANKIMQIFTNPHFKSMLMEIK